MTKKLNINRSFNKTVIENKTTSKEDLIVAIVDNYVEGFLERLSLVKRFFEIEEDRVDLICTLFQIQRPGYLDLNTVFSLDLITLKCFVLNLYVEKIPGFCYEQNDGVFKACLKDYSGEFLPDFSKLNIEFEFFKLLNCHIKTLIGLPKKIKELYVQSTYIKSLEGCVDGLKVLTILDCPYFRSLDGFVVSIWYLTIGYNVEMQLSEESALKLTKLKKKVVVGTQF